MEIGNYLIIHDFSLVLHGCKIFSTLDLVKVYYQIPMTNEDVTKTVIIRVVRILVNAIWTEKCPIIILKIHRLNNTGPTVCFHMRR